MDFLFKRKKTIANRIANCKGIKMTSHSAINEKLLVSTNCCGLLENNRLRVGKSDSASHCVHVILIMLHQLCYVTVCKYATLQ